MTRSPSASAALAVLVLLGCDTGGDAPAKSRVQAVLSEPGGSVEPQPEPRPAGASAAGAGASPAPAKPRPPLCQGQLEGKGSAFKPRALPVRVSLDPARELPKDPLEHGTGRWTWVNFWAAWCVPCKEELPLLFRWRAALGEGIEFRFVSMDDDERQLREFLSREGEDGLRESYWLPDGAARRAWLDALKLTSEPELPLQLLIDPRGMLRCRVEGAVEPGDLAALERIIRG